MSVGKDKVRPLEKKLLSLFQSLQVFLSEVKQHFPKVHFPVFCIFFYQFGIFTLTLYIKKVEKLCSKCYTEPSRRLPEIAIRFPITSS